MHYKQWLHNFWNSFPVQLLLLHFKKHQLILIYWGILFATISGHFMRMFGANSLFLAPEYLDEVNGIAAAMVGAAIGVFIMAWNITTFILYSRHIKFLATTDKPFVTYCLNNFIIPISFLIFYFYKAIDYGIHKELFDWGKMLSLVVGFLGGLAVNFLICFVYFFRADKTITKRIQPVLSMPYTVEKENLDNAIATTESKLIRVKTYLTGIRKTAVVRDVKHYNKVYIETVFSRHHLASVLLIILAFFFLISISFFLDNKYFQIPAAASIIVFFAILLSVFGALAYFLQNWSLPFALVIILLFNYLYTNRIIDPTNKAYGLNYTAKNKRPNYDSVSIAALCTPQQVAADKATMLTILNKWKQRQGTSKPIFYIINVSGGGSRSATFSMHVLQQLDSMLNGALMQKTFMITGASGGMLGASYYKELYNQYQQKKISSTFPLRYVDDIGKDLLNPIFSSLVARDILSPAQKFNWQSNDYLKDRGYAFEQKLNANTGGILQKRIADYYEAEKNALLPLTIYSSVILRDARKMMICTQPISFLMQPPANDSSNLPRTTDAIDFGALLKDLQPQQLSVLTALRMNASFPYVLPTVWLPTNPVIDVMDAGIKDNYGQEIATRFIQTFAEWLTTNVSKVVIISIRDRKLGDWDRPYEDNTMVGSFAKPVTQLQYNIFKVQDYTQSEQLHFLAKHLAFPIEKVVFQYAPKKEDNQAALSFHLTNQEKKSIQENVWSTTNRESFLRMKKM